MMKHANPNVNLLKLNFAQNQISDWLKYIYIQHNKQVSFAGFSISHFTVNSYDHIIHIYKNCLLYGLVYQLGQKKFITILSPLAMRAMSCYIPNVQVIFYWFIFFQNRLIHCVQYLQNFNLLPYILHVIKTIYTTRLPQLFSVSDVDVRKMLSSNFLQKMIVALCYKIFMKGVCVC